MNEQMKKSHGVALTTGRQSSSHSSFIATWLVLLLQVKTQQPQTSVHGISATITLTSLLDKHAPVINKLSRRQSKSNPWFTSTIRAFRSSVRHAENLWKRTHSAVDWSSFKSVQPVPQPHSRSQETLLL